MSFLTPISSFFERASEISVFFVGYNVRTEEGDPLLSRGDDVDCGSSFHPVVTPVLTTISSFFEPACAETSVDRRASEMTLIVGLATKK